MERRKKLESSRNIRKSVADFVDEGKLERAKIKVECIIREVYTAEAMELMEL